MLEFLVLHSSFLLCMALTLDVPLLPQIGHVLHLQHVRTLSLTLRAAKTNIMEQLH